MSWAPIKGFEGLYEVSTAGQIRSIGHRISPRVMKLHTRTRDGYVYVGLAKNKKRRVVKVHRVVAEAFIPGDSSQQVDHINGDRSDNRVENLRWASASVNGSNRTRAWASSGMVGVYKSSSKLNPYRSAVCVDGVKRSLGVFKTASEAHVARLNALKEVGRV
jgi:hypothetical protein